MADVVEWLTLTDVVKITGASADTIRAHTRKGTLVATRTSSGLRIFKRADVERWGRQWQAQARRRRA